jgi:hypothetical protein
MPVREGAAIMIYAQIASSESGATMAAVTWPESDTIGINSSNVHCPSRSHILASCEQSIDKGDRAGLYDTSKRNA